MKKIYVYIMVKKSSLQEFEDEIIGKQAKNLMKKPRKLKDGEKPKFLKPEGAIVQFDTIYFPETNSNFKYVLACIDVATNKCDAEPMRDRSTLTTRDGLKNILRRKNIKLPSLAMVDGGSEFKGQFKQFLESKNVAIQVTQYHRQMLPIDKLCATLAHYLGGAMLSKEIETGRTNTSEWKNKLPKLIKILNKDYTKEAIDPEKLDPVPNETGELLEIGQKVKVLLPKPIDYVEGQRLHGSFRAGDLKWSKEDYTIYGVHITPQQRVLYTVKDKNGEILKGVSFVKQHLQKVS